jgi:hypothetical protein
MRNLPGATRQLRFSWQPPLYDTLKIEYTWVDFGNPWVILPAATRKGFHRQPLSPPGRIHFNGTSWVAGTRLS